MRVIDTNYEFVVVRSSIKLNSTFCIAEILMISINYLCFNILIRYVDVTNTVNKITKRGGTSKIHSKVIKISSGLLTSKATFLHDHCSF